MQRWTVINVIISYINNNTGRLEFFIIKTTCVCFQRDDYFCIILLSRNCDHSVRTNLLYGLRGHVEKTPPLPSSTNYNNMLSSDMNARRISLNTIITVRALFSRIVCFYQFEVRRKTHCTRCKFFSTTRGKKTSPYVIY